MAWGRSGRKGDSCCFFLENQKIIHLFSAFKWVTGHEGTPELHSAACLLSSCPSVASGHLSSARGCKRGSGQRATCCRDRVEFGVRAGKPEASFSRARGCICGCSSCSHLCSAGPGAGLRAVSPALPLCSRPNTSVSETPSPACGGTALLASRHRFLPGSRAEESKPCPCLKGEKLGVLAGAAGRSQAGVAAVWSADTEGGSRASAALCSPPMLGTVP